MNTSKQKIRIGIIEDMVEIQAYLTQEINKMQSCKVDYVVGSWEEFENKYDKGRDYNTDVIFLDLHLGFNKPTGTKFIDFYLSKKGKIPKIIVISSYINDLVIESNRQSGVISGCIAKSVILKNDFSFLEQQINKVTSPTNEEFIVYLDGSLPMYHVNKIDQAVKVIRLTEIQTKILQGLKLGKSFVEIADDMDKNENTIRNHAQKLKRKFNVSSTPQLLMKAQEVGCI
jgi:DNA-binding NarL/FixJ family response regulator